MKIEASKILSLPQDILMDILLRVPVKSLVRCRYVSRYFLLLITSTSFVKMHKEKWKEETLFFTSPSYHHTRTLYSSITKNVNSFESQLSGLCIIGSCNGLVCFSDYLTRIIVCNPATKELMELPTAYMKTCSLGFGYDPITDKYKVIRIECYQSYPDRIKENCKVYIFTLGENAWRDCRKHYIPFRILDDTSIVPYVNGAFHWCRLRVDENSQQLVNSIVSLNVGSEECKYLSTVCKDMFMYSSRLGVLQGCLSQTAFYQEEKRLEIWVMREYDVGDSWTKLFSILTHEHLTPLLVKKDGVVLLRPDAIDSAKLSTKKHLYRYDPASAKVDVCDLGVGEWIDAHMYVETLESVASICGKNTRKKKIHRRLLAMLPNLAVFFILYIFLLLI